MRVLASEFRGPSGPLRVWLAGGLVAWCGVWPSGARATPPVIPEDVQVHVRQRVDYGYCPGVAVGVMSTNGASYFCYGFADLDGGAAVSERTLFEIGSVTKVFTTTVLADMAERGELGLTDGIQGSLPSGVTAPTRAGKVITLTHLAAHTSGLPGAPSNLEPADGNNPFVGYGEQRMFEFLNSYVLPRVPGVQYEYSNYGVGLLGWALARAAGTGYERLVIARIADELGLADTRIQLSAEQRTRLARGHSGVVPLPPFQMDALEAAGDLRSTVQDLLTFLAANRGWLPTRLRPAMVEAQRLRAATPTPGLSVGLGWHLYAMGTDTAVWHNGATIGQRAFAGFLRNGRVVVVALANSDFDVTDLGFHLLDSAAPLTALRQPAVVPESTLRHYVGRYQRGPGDSFELGLLRGHLTLGYSQDLGRRFTLHASGAARFYLTFPEATAVFRTNAAGQATALVWTQSGATTTYPKVRVPATLGIATSGDAVRLLLSGDTDRDYVIEASSDLAGWTPMATNTIWDGPILDTRVSGAGQRFYRVLEP